MEASEDPQGVAISTDTAEVNIPADPTRLPPTSIQGTDRTKTVDEEKIRQQQSQQPEHREDETATQPLPSSSSIAEDAVLDEEKIHSTIDMSINPADVLSGRGKQSFNHVGNKYFRELIAASLDEYMQKQSRFEKSFVVQNIVDEIHGRGGRFLKQDSRTGRYTIELSMTQSREKVGHAIRDAANLHVSRQRQQPPAAAAAAAYHVLAASAAPPSAAAGPGAVSRKPSAKRPRQQQQLSRNSLGSSSSIFSIASNDITSPISGRDIPNLLYQSPIQYSPNLPQPRPGYYYYDPSSPSTSSTSLYRFDPLAHPNIGSSDIHQTDRIAGGDAVFPTQQQSQPAPSYQNDPQLYHQHQQLRQQLQQQQILQQQIGGSVTIYSNFPSQQLSSYNTPIPQQQPTAETIPPPTIQPITGIAANQQQMWIQHRPFMPASYNMPRHATEQTSNTSTGTSSLDEYTQLLFQEQQERFYREYQAAQNRPPMYMGQNLPRQQNNDDNDVFLEAIDSVLGPMDPDNNNNHLDDGLQPQRTDLTVDDSSASLDPRRMTERSILQPHDLSQGQLDSPSDSVEDQKLTTS